jgi:chemotaxis protein MotB
VSGGHGRRKHHEEHEEHVNHEAWVIPYADILTLLMALFLVMWAIARDPSPDPVKAAQVGNGVAEQLGTARFAIPEGGGVLELGRTPSNASAANPGLRELRAEQALQQQQQRAEAIAREQITLDQLEQEIRESLKDTGLEDVVSVSRSERGLYVTVVTDAALFASGRADLGAPGRELLVRLAGPLKTLTNPVVIEGHTDSLPIRNAQYASNWELSTARATNVLRWLVDGAGFPANRLSASGYADTQPVADNATIEGRARNRRVDIVVLAVAATAPLVNTNGPDVRPVEPGLPSPVRS